MKEDLYHRLTQLAEGAKYDVSCSSSGVERKNDAKGLGNSKSFGICHTWSADGRCVSLMKVLLTNNCLYNCAYCINRRDNDIPRARLAPEELANLVMEFYRRNYIEGLFLSSAIEVSPDDTMEKMVRVVELLRQVHHFNGYIHVKVIPGAKQVIIGATPDSDKRILSLSEHLYTRYALKRVYYSAYIPMNQGPNLPSLWTKPPLLREHRLYQADWLLRFYGFSVSELFSDYQENMDTSMDPKLAWALQHLEQFPVEVNKAPLDLLLRVPGIGTTSARRIVQERRIRMLDYEELKRTGCVLKKARHFLLAKGRYYGDTLDRNSIQKTLLNVPSTEQISIWG